MRRRWASALLLPATHPLLAKIGLLGPLDRMGLVAEAAAPEAGAAAGGGARGAGAALIVADEARSEVLTDTVTAIGTARGARSVVLAPEVAGRIVAINVASGDFVKAGRDHPGAGQRGGADRAWTGPGWWCATRRRRATGSSGCRPRARRPIFRCRRRNWR